MQEQQYDELFAAPDARVGEVLRIRLPNDFTVVDSGLVPVWPRPEWYVTAYSIEPAVPPSFWSRMANSILTLAQITRDAVRLFRNSNRFLADVGVAGNSFVPLTCEAHKRSMELLASWLTQEQQESFEQRSYFEVVGNASGVRYRLHSQYSFGIEPLEGKFEGRKLCVIPRGAPALGDILLAQKIGLERNEKATLRFANVSGSRYDDRFA